MDTIVMVVHVLLAVSLIALVLIQHGKGADMGAAFGSGASATVFGARGSASFLTKLTTLLAALFFATSVGLFWFAAQRSDELGSVTDRLPAGEQTVGGESDATAGQGATEIPAVPLANEREEELAPAQDVPSDVPNLPADGQSEGQQ